MAKLPPQFVKAPGAAAATAESAAPGRRARKPSMVTVEAPRDPHDLVLRLTDDELRALDDARDALRRAGEDVSLEQLLHRVLADWTLRTRAAAAPAPAPAPPAERLVDRLRTLAAAPLRTWRELGTTALRRMTGLLAR